jgi:hypothetical protein
MKNTISNLNRASLDLVALAIDEALASVGEKYGLQIATGGGTYGGANASLKLKLSVVNADGSVVTEEAQCFKQYIGMYSNGRMTPEDLGKTFVSKGKTYTVIGLMLRAKKYPILAQRSDGSKFKFSVDGYCAATN